jgi:hypothetical protein
MCPISCDADATALVFSRADLDRPSFTSNQVITEVGDRVLDDFLVGLRTSKDLVTRVKGVIASELAGGAPRDTQVAEGSWPA